MYSIEYLLSSKDTYPFLLFGNHFGLGGPVLLDRFDYVANGPLELGVSGHFRQGNRNRLRLSFMFHIFLISVFLILRLNPIILMRCTMFTLIIWIHRILLVLLRQSWRSVLRLLDFQDEFDFVAGSQLV